MSAAYHKIKPKELPRKNPFVTAETRYWKKFEKAVKQTCRAKVTSIDFSPVAPHDLAVTSASRVELFDRVTCKLKKTCSRFKGVALGGNYRADGKLLAAGGEEGVVRVFDLASRDILRTFKTTNKRPVYVARFSSDLEHVLAAGDDKIVRRLHVPTEVEVAKWFGHTDYVRCGLELPSAPSTWVSGSYDHTVKMWDVRSRDCMLTLKHDHPVEAIVALPQGGIVLAASGNEIKVWDLIAGGKLLTSLSNHQKQITSLALSGDATRLFSGALDHHVKIYDVSTFAVTHSFKYASEVLSVGISPDNNMLAAGLLDGTLSMRNKTNKQPDAADHKPTTKPGAYLMRGHKHAPSTEDFTVEAENKKTGLKQYDRQLKKFQYHLALNSAMATQRAPTIMSVLEALIQRGGLRLALADRDQTGLEGILGFVVKHIDNPENASLMIDLANILLDMYTCVVGQSVAVDELLLKLKRKIAGEVEFQNMCMSLTGCLELVLGSAAASSSSSFAISDVDTSVDVVLDESEATAILDAAAGAAEEKASSRGCDDASVGGASNGNGNANGGGASGRANGDSSSSSSGCSVSGGGESAKRKREVAGGKRGKKKDKKDKGRTSR